MSDATGQSQGAASPVDFVALTAGRTIGRYEVVSVLGQGGFGITYRPTSGFLTGAQHQALLKEAAPAVSRFDEEQKKLEEAKKKAEAEKAKAEAAAKTAPPPATAAPPPLAPNTAAATAPRIGP